MGANSNIQWCDATWNPVIGCKKVSAGCKFCYFFRDQEKYGQNGSNIRRSKTTFNNPLKWKDPQRIFTLSWGDFFIEEVDQWRDEIWDIIRKTPHHTYQILTKRPERIIDHLPADWGEGYDNVWLGVSVEDQDNVGRIAILEKVPAKTKFISFEPLIGPLTEKFVGEVDWIIIGGESGNETGHWRYRPCQLEWIEAIIDGYKDHPLGTKIFVKQLGTHLAKLLQMSDTHGGNIEDIPEYLRIREFPNK